MLTRNDSENALDITEHVVTESWLESILTEHHSKGKSDPSNVTINSFTVSQGTDSSDTVLSDILAITVQAEVDKEPRTYDFIVKLLPLDPFSRFFVTEAEFDLREIQFYTQVVPDLQQLQNQILTDDEPPIVLPLPKCYLAKYVPCDLYDSPSSSPPPAPPPSSSDQINESVIILEDLRKRGYKAVSFNKGLTLEQAESAFEAISRLHALSLAMKVREGKPLNEKYDFFFQTEKASASYQQLMERGLPQLIHFLKKRQDMTEIIDSLTRMRTKTRYLLEKLLTPKEPMSLITHTDFWSNNLLFKDEECVILDWQMATYSRPTNDLALLIISSLPSIVRRDHGPRLLDFYWDHLTRNAGKLHLDVVQQLKYDRETLHEDYKTSQLLALLLCIGSVDVALKDEEIERRLIAVLTDLHRDGVLSPDFVNRLV